MIQRIKEKIKASKVWRFISTHVGRRNSGKTVYPTSTFFTERLSSVRPVGYEHSKEFSTKIKYASQWLHKELVDIKADKYNNSSVYPQIDSLIDREIDFMKEQHQDHISTINDIVQAQLSRVESYEQEIDNKKKEMESIQKKHPDIQMADENYINKKQKDRLPFYKKKATLIIILAIACTLDFCSVSDIIDHLLTENVFLSVLLSIGTATMLNVPISIAGSVAGKKNVEHKKMIQIILFSIFAVLFLIIAALRFASIDTMFVDTSLLNLNGIAEATNTGYSSAQIVMCVLLSIEPLMTSLLSYVFGFLSSTEEEKEHDLEEKRFARLYKECEIYRISVNELKQVVESKRNEYEEDERYKLQLEKLEVIRKNFKVVADLELAKILKDPNASSVVLQGETPLLFEN